MTCTSTQILGCCLGLLLTEVLISSITVVLEREQGCSHIAGWPDMILIHSDMMVHHGSSFLYQRVWLGDQWDPADSPDVLCKSVVCGKRKFPVWGDFNGFQRISTDLRSPNVSKNGPRESKGSLQGSQVHAEGEVVLERLEWPEPAGCTCSGHLLDQQTAARCMHRGQGCLRHIEPPEGQQLWIRGYMRVFNVTPLHSFISKWHWVPELFLLQFAEIMDA